MGLNAGQGHTNFGGGAGGSSGPVDAADLVGGPLPDDVFPAMLPAVDGSQLTNLPSQVAAAVAAAVAAIAAGVVAVLATTVTTTNLEIKDAGGDHEIVITAVSDEAADRTMKIPTLGGNKFFAFTATDGGAVASATNATTVTDGSSTLAFSGATSPRIATTPDANFTIARTDATNTFDDKQSIPALTQKAVSYSCTNKALTGNVATLTIGAHAIKAGDVITSGVASPFGGTFRVSAVTGTTVSFPRTNADIASAGASGTVACNCVGLGDATQGNSDGSTTACVLQIAQAAGQQGIRFCSGDNTTPQIEFCKQNGTTASRNSILVNTNDQMTITTNQINIAAPIRYNNASLPGTGSGGGYVYARSVGSGSMFVQDGTGAERMVFAPGLMQTTGDVTNATATMANVTGLSCSLVAGRKYSFRCLLYVANSTAAEGVAVDFDGGSATMTTFRAHSTILDSTLLLSTQTSAIATDIAVATATGDSLVEIRGSMTVNAAGTFIVRAAENSHTSGTLTVYKGSHLMIEDMN